MRPPLLDALRTADIRTLKFDFRALTVAAAVHVAVVVERLQLQRGSSRAVAPGTKEPNAIRVRGAVVVFVLRRRRDRRSKTPQTDFASDKLGVRFEVDAQVGIS